MFKHILASVLSIAIFTSSTLADSDEERMRQLYDLYQCPIFSYLTAIHRTRFKSEQDRFLILEISDPRGGRYGQCAFFDKDRQIHCEAASPYYEKRLKGYFTADRLKLLGTLGYTTEASSKNYYIERPAAGGKALYEIAGLLVETLGRVFDMQLDELLVYHAPLLKRPPKQNSLRGFCAPVVSMR